MLLHTVMGVTRRARLARLLFGHPLTCPMALGIGLITAGMNVVVLVADAH